MIIITEYFNDFPNSPAAIEGTSALVPIFVFLGAGITHFIIHGLIAAMKYRIEQTEQAGSARWH